MSTLQSLAAWLRFLEKKTPSPWMLLLATLGVGTLRGILEQLLQVHATFGIATLLHYSVFYLAGYALITLWLPRLVGRTWRQLFWLSLLGLCAGLLPPLLDIPVSGLHAIKYSYPFGFAPWFYTGGPIEHGLRTYHISFGEGTAIWLTIAAITSYTWWATRSVTRTALSLVAAWASMQLVSTATITLVFELVPRINPKAIGSVQRDGLTVTVFSLLAALLYLSHDLHRARSALPKTLHAAPFVLTLVVGGVAAGGLQAVHVVFGLVLLVLIWLLIIQNDVYDKAEDTANGHSTKLDQLDADMGHAIALPLILGASLLRTVPGFLLGLTYLLVSMYHHPSLRLKTRFPLPYLIEGAAGALAVLTGVALAARNAQFHNLRHGAFPVLALATLVGYALASTLKDGKDVTGDATAKVQTIYTVLLDRGWTLTGIRRLVALSVTSSHLVVVGLATWLGAPWWQAGGLVCLLGLGFPFLLTALKNRRLAVQGCLILDSLMLLWLCYVLPPLQTVFG